jgi:hypothetical protein
LFQRWLKRIVAQSIPVEFWVRGYGKCAGQRLLLGKVKLGLEHGREDQGQEQEQEKSFSELRHSGEARASRGAG